MKWEKEMGISASKGVKARVLESVEFKAACESALCECLSLTQHAFPGVFPYQLGDASDHMFRSLSQSHLFPLLHPPSQSQIDRALRRTPFKESDHTLSPLQFELWALELFSDALLSDAAHPLRAPIAIASLAIAASIYFTLSR